MKTFTIPTALLALTALVSATPLSPRQFQAQITLCGAGPNPPCYTLSLPTDGSAVAIDNPLSVSHIYSEGGATCGFTGIDGSQTTIVGRGSVDVGPPQTQVSASCLAL